MADSLSEGDTECQPPPCLYTVYGPGMSAAAATSAVTDPGTDHRLHVNGVTLRVRTTGAGRPLLLLHGFPDSLEEWDGLTPRFVAAGFRVIAIDQRGFGESDAPRVIRNYHADRIVADAVAVLDALGVGEPVDLVAHDWGAIIGWMLCLAHPDRIRRYVALSVGHPKAYATSGLEQKRKGLYVGLFQLRGAAERLISRHDFAWLRGWAPSHFDMDAVVRDLSRPGRLTAGLSWYRANLPTIFLRRWGHSTVPTLGVLGIQDKYLSEDQMLRSEALVDAPWRYVRIDDAGHWLTHDQPERVAALCLEWFAAD
jgi:pimeloyl-ACP methyl ester carboxylesterase